MMKKPGLEEIKSFCLEIGLTSTDGEYSFHHWEGNGWTVAGKPIKRWKGVIQSWRLAGYMPSQRNGKASLPKAEEVRKVIRDYRAQVIGANQSKADEFWEGTFQRKLHCSYRDAMSVLK